jgi:hypothetical protein
MLRGYLRKEESPHAMHMGKVLIEAPTIVRGLNVAVLLINEGGHRVDDPTLAVPGVEQAFGEIHAQL